MDNLSTNGPCVLLADIGGTNARFALADSSGVGSVEHARTADFPGPAEAISGFLHKSGRGRRVVAAALAAAGPVENGRTVVMTNSGWTIDAVALAAVLGTNEVGLLNDFEALAWSLPVLPPKDLFPLGGKISLAGAPMLVLGPGTGFGTSCLVSDGTAQVAIISEAGHATLAATSEREAHVIAHIRDRIGHVSVERALSGPGLENLYQAVAAIDGVNAPTRDAAAITEAALNGSCAVCRASLEMFCALLGSVAGNLAVTFCARGGVFIAGGIAPRFPEFLHRSEFRARFEEKGRFHDYLAEIPAQVILKTDATFLGLKAFLDRRAASPR